MAPPTDFQARVVAVVEALRPGDVVTYGEVALEAGRPGAARAVGNLMASVEGLPWWRVVHADGRLVPGNEREQARRLQAEGVTITNDRVAPSQRSGRPRR
ncbi:MAG: methylated-DNA-protein-cysteine methyltransferase related protein [Actinomycetota bacterium]